MTVEEMAEIILRTVEDYAPASLVEIVRACGEEAKGEYLLTMPGKPNAILWAGISQKFGDAFNLIRQKTEIAPTSWMIYMMDGGALDLPIMKNNIRSLDFKKPTWCPVVLSLKKTKAEEAA